MFCHSDKLLGGSFLRKSAGIRKIRPIRVLSNGRLIGNPRLVLSLSDRPLCMHLNLVVNAFEFQAGVS